MVDIDAVVVDSNANALAGITIRPGTGDIHIKTGRCAAIAIVLQVPLRFEQRIGNAVDVEAGERFCVKDWPSRPGTALPVEAGSEWPCPYRLCLERRMHRR